MTLLVTGASSFVGKALRRLCAMRGIDTFGIDLVGDGTKSMLEADIRDPDLADKLPDSIDTVVHLAAIARDSDCRRNPVLCYDVNVSGTANVAAAAHAKGVRQFVFASSEWVYDRLDPHHARGEEESIDPMALNTEYALSKLMGEAVLRQVHLRTGMAVTVLRFGIIYGPRHDNWSAVEALLAKVASGETVSVGSGRTARGFLHVDDIADAILSALGRGGFETFNIQADRPITLREVAEASAAILGRSLVFQESDPGNPSIRNLSGARAREALGWMAKISLHDGLTDVARFLGYLPKNDPESVVSGRP